MKKKRNITLTTLGMALGTVLIVTQAAWSDKEPQSFKLEDARIGKVPGTPVTWSHPLIPAPSGSLRFSRFEFWFLFVLRLSNFHGSPTISPSTSALISAPRPRRLTRRPWPFQASVLSGGSRYHGWKTWPSLLC